MNLGTLSLFQKKGLFHKEHQFLSEDTYSGLENPLMGSGFGEQVKHGIPWKQELVIVDENGNTDFIKAIFEDEGNGKYPYEVTVWLLIEEGPVPVPPVQGTK